MLPQRRKLVNLVGASSHSSVVARRHHVVCDISHSAAPDGVLLDVGMPERSGMEIAEELRDSGSDAIIIVGGPNPLAARERDALHAVQTRVTVAEIASRLHLSTSTVGNYITAAIAKTHPSQ